MKTPKTIKEKARSLKIMLGQATDRDSITARNLAAEAVQYADSGNLEQARSHYNLAIQQIDKTK